MPSLVGTSGTDAGKAHALSRATILGRQKGVDILVEDIGASREHAKVFSQDGDWFVIDLGSRNGTKVNGKPVTRAPLHHGDTITIGTSGYRFDAPELAAKAPPPAPAGAQKPAAAAASAAKPRGPSAIEMERERLRAASGTKTAPAGRPKADDGSGIVIRETVLQYGRVEDKGGLLGEDIGQRGFLFKALVSVVLVAIAAGIAWGLVAALEKEPVEEPEAPLEAK